VRFLAAYLFRMLAGCRVPVISVVVHPFFGKGMHVFVAITAASGEDCKPRTSRRYNAEHRNQFRIMFHEFSP